MEAHIFFASAGMFGGGYANGLNQTYSEAYIQALSPSQVNAFDRPAIYRHSQAAAIASDAMVISSFAIPVTLMFDKKIRKDAATILVMDLEVIAVSSSITELVKESVHRTRPLVYDNSTSLAERLKAKNFKSFFSGHTATVAGQTYFFAYVYTVYHPHSRWLPLVWTGAAALPALTGLCRYEAGKHFWTDIITGYAVGALVGAGVPWLHSHRLWGHRLVVKKEF